MNRGKVSGGALRTAVFESLPGDSPLGQVTLAAAIQNGRGIVPPRPLRVYGRYALVFITQGRGTYQDAGPTARDVEAGDVIFVYPELAHTYGPRPGETWSEFYLVFHGPVFHAWRTLGAMPRTPVCRLSPIDGWLQKFQAVAAPARPAAPGGQALQVCRLLTLITEIAALSDAQPGGDAPTGDAWLTRACTLLGEELGAPHAIGEFARRLSLSEPALRKRFGAALGVSPTQYRTARRLDAACDLLQYTGLTNAQIAEALGFSDEYHFSKRFKQGRGETPTQFRRRLLG